MTPRQHLCYALGELTYAVAKADGIVTKEERQKLHTIISAELSPVDFNYEISKIIFEMSDKQNKSSEKVYEEAVEKIQTYSDCFDPQLKLVFLRTLEKMERAVPPVTDSEKNLLHKFREEIKNLSN